MPMIPTVHMNGTSKADLLNGYCLQMSAIRHALETMQQTGPNGRDYYTQGPEAFKQAQLEHHARMDKLRDAFNEIEAIAEAIA